MVKRASPAKPVKKPAARKRAPAKAVAKAPRGRQTIFTQEIATAICEKLANGDSLRSVCESEEMPAESTVRSWALDDIQGFGAQYTRAREIGFEKRAEEILLIADTPLIGVKTKTNEKGEVETTEGDMIEHRRLQVDARKWLLSKMLPKRYGEKLALGGAEDLPPVQMANTYQMSESELIRIASTGMQKPDSGAKNTGVQRPANGGVAAK